MERYLAYSASLWIANNHLSRTGLCYDLQQSEAISLSLRFMNKDIEGLEFDKSLNRVGTEPNPVGLSPK